MNQTARRQALLAMMIVSVVGMWPQSASAQHDPFTHPAPATLPPRETAVTGESARVSFTPDPAGRPLVSAQMGDAASVTLMVDIGTNGFILDPAVVQRRNLSTRTLPDGRIFAVVPEVRVGSVVFRGLIARVLPGIPNAEGILGSNVFRNVALTLDYQAARVEIGEARLEASAAHTIPITLDPSTSVPVFSVSIGGTQHEAIFDTGSPIGLTVSSRLAATLPLAASHTPPVRLAGPGFAPVSASMRQLHGTVRVGSVELPNPQLAVADIAPYGGRVSIGVAVLRATRMTLDQRSLLVRLTPARVVLGAPH